MKRPLHIGSVGIICLTFILLGMMICSYVFVKHEGEDMASPIVSEKEILPAGAQKNNITNQTHFLVQTRNLNTGEVSVKEEPLPKAFIGLSREQLILRLENMQYYGMTDEEVRHLELLTYGSDRILVEKTVLDETKAVPYYITVSENVLLVLYSDKETVYMETGIALNQVPDSMQKSMIEGYPVASEQELFDLLESFSS